MSNAVGVRTLWTQLEMANAVGVRTLCTQLEMANAVRKGIAVYTVRNGKCSKERNSCVHS